MAEKAQTEPKDQLKEGASGGKGGALSLLPALLNTVALVAAAGVLYYTRFLYRRPAITETGERTRLAEMQASPTPQAVPVVVGFDKLTVNIASNPMAPLPADGTSGQLQGKLHYLTFTLALEIRDSAQRDAIEQIRPFFLDRLLTILGRKRFNELNSVEGRYVLRSQIMDLANQIVAERAPSAAKNGGLVTNAFFSEFILQ